MNYRSIWASFSRIWEWEGADPRTSGTFYKVVVQATLLFDSETWVMNPRIGRTLGRFHHRVAHHLAGMKPKQYMGGAVIIPAYGRSNDGGGARGGGDIYPPPPEHHYPVYFDSSYNGTMSGDGKEARSMGVIIVRRSVRDRHRYRGGEELRVGMCWWRLGGEGETKIA